MASKQFIEDASKPDATMIAAGLAPKPKPAKKKKAKKRAKDTVADQPVAEAESTEGAE